LPIIAIFIAIIKKIIKLEKYGFNELEEKRKITALKILLRQFANFIVWVLFAAAMISLIVGEEQTTVICTDKTGTLTKNEMTVAWKRRNKPYFRVPTLYQVEGKTVLIFRISVFNPSSGGNKGSVKVGD
jgi:hypothetical protein